VKREVAIIILFFVDRQSKLFVTRNEMNDRANRDPPPSVPHPNHRSPTDKCALVLVGMVECGVLSGVVAMTSFGKIFVFVLVLVTAISIGYLYPLTQHVVRIAGGYASKSICSGVFVSKRSHESIVKNELDGVTSLLMISHVDYASETVTSSLFGLSSQIITALGFTTPTAKYLGKEFGCQLIIDPYLSHSPVKLSNRLETPPPPPPPVSLTPLTPELHEEIDLRCMEEFLAYEFTKEAFHQNQTRAIVISHHGEVIYESYQTTHLNLTAATPLLGWSMTKSVLAILIGIGIEQKLLTLDTPLRLSTLSEEHKRRLLEQNHGEPLTIRSLLHMSDILHIEEDYSILGPIVHFLYGVHDITHFINQPPLSSSESRPPPEGHPFGWYYSSAVTNLLSAELRALFPSDEEYWAFPSRHLSRPLSLSSFLIELDPSGTFIASSFGYGTARDWTKLGYLLLNDGKVRKIAGENEGEEQRLLSSEFVKFLMTTTPLSGGMYGGHLWMNPLHASEEVSALLPANHSKREQLRWLGERESDGAELIPADTVFFSGYHGQYVLIVPSRGLVITRLGMSENKDEVWSPRRFFGTLLHRCWRQGKASSPP
jgi:CubicO group peptidase (beta-lactamase class C family)